MTEKARVLIVDDSPLNIRTLSGILWEDYNLSVATSGQEAIDLILGKVPPDLILMDIMMPGMDGYQACNCIKEYERVRDIPVIFVTAMTDVEDETKGFACGAVDYITKPVSPSVVKSRVQNHLLIKKQRDKLKKSMSIIEHKSEILQQKAELGIQASGLAHDINNILSALMIIEFIPEMVTDDCSQKELIEQLTQKALGNIHLGVEVCQGFTSFLQDMDEEMKIQPVLPLMQPVDMYSRKFKGEIIKDFSDEQLFILCKGYQVKRVIINVLTNACQAIENQDEQIITIKTWGSEEQVFISIKDNGMGIPANIMPDIFTELFTTKKIGTGLGLSMAKEIMDNHDALISVDTKEGQGTTFILSFPAVISSQ
jgi:CheY-like chemotaxis protein